MIVRKVTRSGALLTIVNYGKFQDMRSANRSTSGARPEHWAEHKRSETKNDKRMIKQGKKESVSLSGENQESEESESSAWFDALEDENDSAEH